MFKRHIKTGLILLVFTMIFLSYVQGPVHAEDIAGTRNILIVNSYHQGLTWTDDQVCGIIETFKNQDRISVYVEYMDWKNYPTTRNIEYLNNYFHYKYQDKNIDLLITTDDKALEYVLENRESLFANAPVVFSGVNSRGISQITKGYRNLTGVTEVIDPKDTIRMALSINPSVKNIYLLYDNSESGLSTGSIAEEEINSMNLNLNIISWNNLSYEEILKKVKDLKDDSIILVTTYYSDVEGKVVGFENTTRKIAFISHIPLYHLYDFGLNNGALGGDMLSGRLQGQSAASLALRILNGEIADSIPIQFTKTTRKVIDFNQLEKFNIPLSVIPEDAEIIHKPFSFFETYKKLVSCVVLAFIVLISFAMILLLNLRRIKKLKDKLSEKHEELTQIYEELAASDEELKEQYDAIKVSNEKIRVSEEKFNYLAYHDGLTGLLNKLSLYENAIKDSFWQGKNAGLLFVDIDNFKYINDTMGHDFGDKLLRSISDRLASLLVDGCSLYRLSGDEFIVIVKNINSEEDAETLAAHILAGFGDEFKIADSILYLSPSIGIAMYPKHSVHLEELLKYADIAMYKAKEQGRNRYVIYNETMNQDIIERVNIEKYLHTALLKNEFEIYYQPQLDIRSEKITGFEALLRWNSPELGRISPLKFIKVAEDTHIIIPLGIWVLKKACAFLKKLHMEGYNDLTVSVNISIIQLLQTDFVETVMDILELQELEPEFLELEITESILIESYENICSKLETLKDRGIRIALDDFGKGYSSLSYLKQLPISTIKIDKSFVDHITYDPVSNNLIRKIIEIGKSMGMRVVAEGVETPEQLKFLKKHRCNRIQGYLFSMPIPEMEAEVFLKKG